MSDWIIIGLIAYILLDRLLGHLRNTDCVERNRALANEASKTTLNAYRYGTDQFVKDFGVKAFANFDPKPTSKGPDDLRAD